MGKSDLVEVQNLKKIYGHGDHSSAALKVVSFTIEAGQFTSIMGPSGSGKSTLLHLIGGLDRPTSGSVLLDQHPLETYDDDELSTFRRQRLGFIFQFFNRS